MNSFPLRFLRPAGIAAGVLVGLTWFCLPLLAEDYPPRALPENDRKTLNEYLGSDVVGEAVRPPALPHGING